MADENAVVAHGADTLLGVLHELAEFGYTEQFRVTDEGIVCPGCSTTAAAEDFVVERDRRLEGASDAADLMLVVAGRCPQCEARGVLTLGYGPQASEAESAVLEALDMHRATADPAARTHDA